MSYREEVLRNCNPEFVADEKAFLNLGALGIAGEAGECADVVKKHLFHGVPLDRDKLLKELGDVRWYMEVLIHAIGTTMEEVEQKNVEKLRLRYPDGFTTQASIERKDVNKSS